MIRLKRRLKAAGFLLLLMAAVFHQSPTENKSIWEEIPENEKAETYFQETGETEDIPVNADIQIEETGQSAESISQSSGQVTELSIEDADMLLKVAQAEAGNQGQDGMWLVMCVVLNRVNSPDYPDTVGGVIYQEHQFATVSNGAIDIAEPSPECHLALARIEKGDIAPEIIGFETTDSNALDKYFCEAFTYKDHKFYTKK